MRLLAGDALLRLKELEDESVQCCVTSPPYWGLRDYKTPPVIWPDGWTGHLGAEPTPEQFVRHLTGIFEQVRRVLRLDGTLWLNIGDSYNSGSSGGLGGSTISGGQRNQAESNRHGRPVLSSVKHKDLIGVPWMLAFSLRASGWYLRQDIIWHKPNPMPESVRDRCTKAHEYLFLLSKSSRYYFDAGAIKEPAITGANGSRFDRGKTAEHQLGRASTKVRDDLPMRNKRSVWTVTPASFTEAHFATFPSKLIEPCILAACPPGGLVIDPFSGAGTTGIVCEQLGRDYIGIELNPDYIAMTERRLTAARASSGI